MLINLFALVIIYTLFFIVIIGSGVFFNKFFFKEQKLSLGEMGIYGFFNIYLLVLITHFFFPINQFIIISTGLLFIILFINNISNIFKKNNLNNISFLFVFIIFLTLSITNNHHDDLYIFQLPIINYMQNHKIVFGLIIEIGAPFFINSRHISSAKNFDWPYSATGSNGKSSLIIFPLFGIL